MKLKTSILIILIIAHLFMSCVILRSLINKDTKITVSIINYHTQDQYYSQLWYGKRDIEKFIVNNNWWLKRFRIAENTYKVDLYYLYMYYGQTTNSVTLMMDGISWYTKVRHQFDVAISASVFDWDKFRAQVPTKLSNCIVLVRIDH